MSYHPRIESPELANFLTTRTRNSELWFINNPALSTAILGYAALCTERYDVTLYALAIEGNHIHAPVHFPKSNRASFMRDFNSFVARAVPRYTPEYPGGRLWGRRYSVEFVPGNEDIENQFFYTVLQPIQDGLVERISDAPGYNCFHDAIFGIERKFKVVRWRDYNAAKRYNSKIRISDFSITVRLKFARLPGYENLGQREYARTMQEKLETRRLAIIAQRRAKGLGFSGRERLRQTPRGALPRDTKTSNSLSHRPRVLSVCNRRRAECKQWYFDIYFKYKEASRRYRAGERDVEFPPWTYRPYCDGDFTSVRQN